MWVFIGNMPKTAKGAVGIFIMLFIFYPYILLLFYMGFCGHKDEIEITKVECHGYSSREIDGYVGNRNCLDFTIEVEFDNKRILSFEVDTLVYNKEGKCVGYISETFEGNWQKKENSTPCFEPNTTQTFSYYEQYNGWSSYDHFLEEIYYGDVNDYTFEAVITCIYFLDGTIVGHHNDIWHEYDENGDAYWEEVDY